MRRAARGGRLAEGARRGDLVPSWFVDLLGLLAGLCSARSVFGARSRSSAGSGKPSHGHCCARILPGACWGARCGTLPSGEGPLKFCLGSAKSGPASKKCCPTSPELASISCSFEQVPNEFALISAKSGPSRIKLGPNSTNCGPYFVVDQLWPMSTNVGPLLAKVWPYFVQIWSFWPNLGRGQPILADVDQLWADVGRFWPMSTKFGPSSANFGRCRPNMYRIRPILGDFDQPWAEIDQIWPMSIKFGPKLSNFAEKWAGV